MARIETRDKFGDFYAVEEVFNGSLGAGAAGDADVDVSGYSVITVMWILLATTTTADLTNGVFPFRVDGVTVESVTIPQIRGTVSTSDGTNVAIINQYDVRGIPKVKIRGRNNNVGAKTLVTTVFYGRDAV